ncbi:MAG: glycosyltransferase family 2 protein [Sphingobium sp.]
MGLTLIQSLNGTLKSPDETEASPSVTVIIPAYNARATLPACLKAISGMNRPADEVLLFSDGSTDETDKIAREAGVTVIRNDGAPRGPGHGRNQAALHAKSDLLLFVDADVVISPEALERLVADMRANGAKAAFGSYDDAPWSQRVTSLYANLRHHYVHQQSKREAKTFWSGLGLMDREVFLAAGGFDVEMFAHPSIEDIELGARVIAAGHRIRLVPEALCKHWKDWSLWRVWHTDVVRRAMPWSRLIVDGKAGEADLNISWVERVKSLLALATVLSLLAALVTVWFGPVVEPALFLTAALVCALLYIWLNRAFFGFLAKRLGVVRSLGAMAMHLCYHIYAPVTFVLISLEKKLGLRGR